MIMNEILKSLKCFLIPADVLMTVVAQLISNLQGVNEYIGLFACMYQIEFHVSRDIHNEAPSNVP